MPIIYMAAIHRPLSRVYIGEVYHDNAGDSDNHCSGLGHLGQCKTDRIVSNSCCAAKGGQGKYCRAAQGDCRV
jgi:hypothetical protein